MQVLTPIYGIGHAWRATDDDTVTMLLTVLFVVVCVLLPTYRQTIALQVESVFAPESSRKGLDSAQMQNTGHARMLALMMAAVLAGAAAVLTLLIAHRLWDPAADLTRPLPPMLFDVIAKVVGPSLYMDHMVAVLLLASGVVWYAFLLLKHWFTSFVNWTFFPADAKVRWQCVYRLSLTLHAVCVLAAAMVVVCNDLNITFSAVLCIIALLPGLLVTIWGVWRLFFGKMVGCLHFLLYLCTLELMLPAMVTLFQAFLLLPMS
ncbi:MAG: DUF4271 domain-containing protein [Bacteroidaceae bacterium]|nr:DUF4271 domain-containing protein [Bacteroidaceae bacterium]